MSEALARKNYARVCNLMSYGAEAQIFVGAAFASLAGPDSDDKSSASCATAFRTLNALAEEDVKAGLAGYTPSRAEVDAGRISIRGSRATVKIAGQSPEALIRIDGRWLIDADLDKPLTPADYERCWRVAGATIAARASELRFAAKSRARHIAATTSRVSVKGKNWRIFYTVPDEGEDPGLAKVLRDPNIVSAVAYIKDASAHPHVVTKARACGDQA